MTQKGRMFTKPKANVVTFDSDDVAEAKRKFWRTMQHREYLYSGLQCAWRPRKVTHGQGTSV